MMVLQLVWVKLMVPETKGISLEKMHLALGIDAEPALSSPLTQIQRT